MASPGAPRNVVMDAETPAASNRSRTPARYPSDRRCLPDSINSTTFLVSVSRTADARMWQAATGPIGTDIDEATCCEQGWACPESFDPSSGTTTFE